MSGHAQLTKTGQRMLSDIAKLQARHHLFMEALNTDLDFYDEQASSGRLSKCYCYYKRHKTLRKGFIKKKD